MRSRWTILAVLFVARAAMAFQFQSVAAVAPQYSQGLGASLADIGVLIGLYFAPGAALALPGGSIGLRAFDARRARLDRRCGGNDDQHRDVVGRAVGATRWAAG